MKERAAAALGGAALLGSAPASRKPEAVSWGGLWGMSILCGIGFTMRLFIGYMNNILNRVKHEVLEVIPPAVFFLIVF